MVEIAAYDQLYAKRYHPYTEALLSAIPQVDAADRRERIRLTGEVPSPSDPPSGCRFHTRCPKACDRCSKEVPELMQAHFDAGEYGVKSEKGFYDYSDGRAKEATKERDEKFLKVYQALYGSK